MRDDRRRPVWASETAGAQRSPPSRAYISALRHLARHGGAASSSFDARSYSHDYRQFNDDDDDDDVKLEDASFDDDDNSPPPHTANAPPFEDQYDANSVTTSTTTTTTTSRIASLATPKHPQAKVETNGISKTSMDWIEFRSRQLPGVGAHDLETCYRRLFSSGSPRRGGGTLNYDLHARWHARDRELAATSQLPGPGAHLSITGDGYADSDDDDLNDGDNNSLSHSSCSSSSAASSKQRRGKASKKTRGGGGCTISAGALPLTPLDLVIRRAAGIPSPQDYRPRDARPSLGARFNKSRAKSNLEWQIHDAKQKPGPGAYTLQSGRTPGGGRFNLSVAKSELEWTIWRAKQVRSGCLIGKRGMNATIASSTPKIALPSVHRR